MNQLVIIGNLTRDPETRTAQSTGNTVCGFDVAVNRRGPNGDETVFFRVSAWGELGEACQQYLAKGRKVAVVGEVSARAYSSREGEPRASLEVMANKVEFLTPRGGDVPAQGPAPEAAPGKSAAPKTGFLPIGEDSDLPF